MSFATFIADSTARSSWRAQPRSFVALMGLYESNYTRLGWLVEDIRALRGSCRSIVSGDCDLVLTVAERSPYTVTFTLTYELPGAAPAAADRAQAVSGIAEPGSADSGTRWALLSARQLSFQGQPAMLTAFTPINRLKRLEQRLQLWAKVFEASSESILILDVDRRVLTANQAFSRASGWDLTEVVGQSPEFLYSTHHTPQHYEALWQAAVIRGSWQGELWLKRKNGEAYPTWLVANVVRNPDGRITHLVAAAVDISEHKANEARIHHCLLYTSPSPRDRTRSRMPSSA